MKNLKKLLSVVLAIVLAFCLVVPASAANVSDYPDADDVTYTEAVDLFTALGFLQGRDTGKFDPQGLVTREEAAKIITYMLIGSSRADSLTTTVSDFSDVTIGRWSAPYIQYCATLGIINGMGDGTFNPTGNVTGAQFAKMLLCAVGYGLNDEYTGSNWAMKTIADATNLGILSLNVDYSAGATREEVSQYGFNAYTGVKTVVWNSQTQAYQQAINIDGVDAKGSLATQQGVKNDVSTYTNNGTTYYRWTKMGSELTGGYTKEKVIGTNTMGFGIDTLSDSSSAFYIASLENVPPEKGANPVEYYYNGTKLAQVATSTGSAVTAVAAGSVYYNTTEKAVVLDDGDGVPEVIASDKAVYAPGVIINFVNTDSDSKIETVQVIKKSVAVLSGDPVVSGNKVTISSLGISGVSTVKVPGYDTLKDKDVVLWYKNTTTGEYFVDKATSVTGTISSFVSKTNVTIGGETYKYSGLAFPDPFKKDSVNTWAGLADTTLYFDDGGYICYGKQAVVSNPAAPYAFIDSTRDSGYITQAVVVLSDGTSKVVTIDKANSDVASLTAVHKFFSYMVNSDGHYVFKALAASGVAEIQEDHTYAVSGNGNASANIVAGNPYFLSNNSTQFANGSTRFVYANGISAASNAYYTYKGVANAPKFDGKAYIEKGSNGTLDSTDIDPTSIFTLYNATTNAAVFVYAVAPYGQSDVFIPSTTTGDWVYVMSGNYTTNYVSSTLSTHSYKAAINGVYDEKKPLTVDAAKDGLGGLINGQPGLYRVTGYDANGYATLVARAGSLPATTPASFNSDGTNGFPVNNATTTLISDSLNISGNVIKYKVPVAGIEKDADAKVLADNAKIYFVDTTNEAMGEVLFYEISAAQANAFDTNGAKIDMHQVSGSDSSIAALYIRDKNTTGQTTTLMAPAATVVDTDDTHGYAVTDVTVTLTSFDGTTATYSVTFANGVAEYSGADASTFDLSTGSWATLDTPPTDLSNKAGTPTQLELADGNTGFATTYTTTFTVIITAPTTVTLTINDNA